MHKVYQIKYRDKLIWTSSSQNIDLGNIKYTISFNKDRTRLQHLLVSKDLVLSKITEKFDNDLNRIAQLEITSSDLSF